MLAVTQQCFYHHYTICINWPEPLEHLKRSSFCWDRSIEAPGRHTHTALIDNEGKVNKQTNKFVSLSPCSAQSRATSSLACWTKSVYVYIYIYTCCYHLFFYILLRSSLRRAHGGIREERLGKIPQTHRHTHTYMLTTLCRVPEQCSVALTFWRRKRGGL